MIVIILLKQKEQKIFVMRKNQQLKRKDHFMEVNKRQTNPLPPISLSIIISDEEKHTNQEASLCWIQVLLLVLTISLIFNN